MKDALLIELAATWELQAETGGDGLNRLQPAACETLRACADALRMMVDTKWPSAEPSAVHQAPEGWQLVPVEPTTEMKIAGDNAGWWCADKYRAMLAAAPKAGGET